VSTVDNCVYSFNVEGTNVIFYPTQRCKDSSELLDIKDWYHRSNCRGREEGDSGDFIQVKLFHDKFTCTVPAVRSKWVDSSRSALTSHSLSQSQLNSISVDVHIEEETSV